MLKEYFMLLLLAHILGDFYVQTDFMARKKCSRFKWILIHGVCYWSVVLLVSIPVMSWRVALFGSASAALHMAIDAAKYLYLSSGTRKTSPAKTEKNVFFADQALHLIVMATIAYLFAAQNGTLQLSENAGALLNGVGVPAKSLLHWAVALLLIHRPINIAISLLLTPYRPDNRNGDVQKDKNAGRFIGTLERAIILILISLNQYSAIGLVLTAKSIARYDKITKDPAFSEYYLLGTLLSALAVIATAFIL
jgi:hypothetical protein